MTLKIILTVHDRLDHGQAETHTDYTVTLAAHALRVNYCSSNIAY